MSCNDKIWLKSKEMYVDCGKCLGCRQKKARAWTYRLLCELRFNPKATFLTLTYDELQNPITLRRDDVQKFIKRLRHKLPLNKYFLVGEYGDSSSRPHYHAIFFGFYPTPEIHKIIQDTWNMGFIDTAGVEAGSIAYTVGYCAKKLCDNNDDYKKWNVEPPFMLCSKGIGMKFINNFNSELVEKKYGLINGFKYPLSRYIREKLGLTYADYKDIIAESQNELFNLYNGDIYVDFQELHDAMNAGIPIKEYLINRNYNYQAEKVLASKTNNIKRGN